MKKLFDFIKQGAGKRILQMTVLSNGNFEAVVVESGSIVAKAVSTTADATLVSLAISVMNLEDRKKPARWLTS